MWDLPDVTGRAILTNRTDIVLRRRKKEDLPTARYGHTRLFNL